MRNVVVIGGSAGAIDSFCKVIEGLPADLPVAVGGVIHLGEGNYDLSNIFRKKCGSWEVKTARKTQPLKEGCAVLAPPDHHLLVQKGRFELSHGARENRHRPSIDVLFRSAAKSYRSRVIGVVLSGMLDDGTGGSFAIQSRGGIVIVQDPSTTRFPEMPTNVIRYTDVNHCLPINKIGPMIAKIVSETPEMDPKGPPGQEQEHPELIEEPNGKPAFFVCPECDGRLIEVRNGELSEYACQVGHRFSLESLSEAQADALERALWIALRRLSEQRVVQTALLNSTTSDGSLKKRYEENLEIANRDIVTLRGLLERL